MLFSVGSDTISRYLRCSDKPIYLTADDLRDDSGLVNQEYLDKAIKYDEKTKRSLEAAQKLLKKMHKEVLKHWADLHESILQEGIENLETESGRYSQKNKSVLYECPLVFVKIYWYQYCWEVNRCTNMKHWTFTLLRK